MSDVVESWLLEDGLGGRPSIIRIESALRPLLVGGQQYWLALTPGQDVSAGNVIDLGWVVGSIPLGTRSIFARRNNATRGQDGAFVIANNIDDVLWATGSGGYNPSQAGYSLRVFGTPVPEPSGLALFVTACVAATLSRRRR